MTNQKGFTLVGHNGDHYIFRKGDKHFIMIYRAIVYPQELQQILANAGISRDDFFKDWYKYG